MSVERDPRWTQEHQASAGPKGRIERTHGLIRQRVGLSSRATHVATLSEFNQRLDSLVRDINRRSS